MFIYYNPHVDDFLAEPLQFRLIGRRALKKYGFLFDEARRNGAPIRVLVDGTSSGLIPESIFHLFPGWLRLIFSSIEFFLWKKINGFADNIERVAIPTAPVEENLLAFSYKSATGRFKLREKNLLFYRNVIFHLSHYFISTSEKSCNIRGLPNALLAGDSDITCNSYFQHYFDWYKKKFLILPFAVSGRFTRRTTLIERSPKAVATGSFHDLRYEKPAHKYIDFMTTTGATSYHPVRLELYHSRNDVSDSIVCRISPYRTYKNNSIAAFLSHFQVAQRVYFSINIVDLYNEYRFAIIGEELSGFLALGALEAMACGCVLIANADCYKGLDLLPGTHYLTYNGSVSEIVNLVKQSDIAALDRISRNASEFVLRNFCSNVVYNKWSNTIENV